MCVHTHPLSGVCSWLWGVAPRRRLSIGFLICGDADDPSLPLPWAWFWQPLCEVVCPHSCAEESLFIKAMVRWVPGARLSEAPVSSELGSFMALQHSALRWGLLSVLAVSCSRPPPASRTLFSVRGAGLLVFTPGGSFSRPFEVKTSESNLNA